MSKKVYYVIGNRGPDYVGEDVFGSLADAKEQIIEMVDNGEYFEDWAIYKLELAATPQQNITWKSAGKTED